MAAHEQPQATEGAVEPERAALLEVSSLACAYGRRSVLFDVALHVMPGEIVGMFGHNGAGKTTSLNAIYGLVKPRGGTVRFDGDDVTGHHCARNVRRGMAYIAAENFVFRDLTVADNLRLGAYLESSRAAVAERLRRIYEIFPILEERTSQVAGTMSGGQQRMLSVGIALMSNPRLILVDEPSLGLAPTIIEQVMDVISRLARDEGLAVLLVEQNVVRTLPVIDRAYFMRSGRIILEERAEELRKRDQYWDLF